jgi:hypothetical protein
MKKVVSVISVVLVLGLIATVAGAQYTTITSFQVQNLSSEVVEGQVQFYKASDGDEVIDATVPFTITANSSHLFTQGNNDDLPEGFTGSVVVSANQPVAAIGVQEAKDPAGNTYQGTYSGFSAQMASDKFYIPTVMKAFYGFTTEISVQNAGSTEVNVTINYDGGHTDSVTGLKPGAVHRFDNADTSGMPDAYIGYGIITATGGEIVAVVNQNNVGARQQQTYEGFSEAGSGDTLYAPVLMKNFYGFVTSVQVQNVSTASTDVTIHYSNGYSETQTLATEGASYLFTQGNEDNLPDAWIGSAVIESSSGNIVAVVNQQNSTTNKASSYNAFSGGATSYVGPNVMKAFYGFNTSVQVQNVGSTPATCRATFSNGTFQDTPTQLDQYETYLFTQGNNNDLGGSFIGSVELSCGGNEFVAIVNQEGATGSGDTSMAYNGIAGQ